MAGKNSGKLEVTLPSDTEILLSRVFDAPRHLVFEVFTNPAYVREWYGCPIAGSTMPVCEIDLRVGGTYRYVTRTADGQEFGFTGVYQEIVVPERVVHTEIFEPFPDSPSLNTMTLVERGGKTYFQTLVKHASKQARDMHIQSGMEHGAGIALDRAEELAQELVAPGAAVMLGR
jgi:uncharacterized protein YndB with AHSA1/START domain